VRITPRANSQEEAEQEIKALRREFNKAEMARNDLERLRKRLKILHDKPTADAQRKNLRDQIETHAQAGFAVWKEYMASTSNMFDMCGALDRGVLAECQAASNVRAVEEASNKREGKIAELGEVLDEHMKLQARAKERQKEQIHKLKQIIEHLPDEDKEEAHQTATVSH
jgi:hypothetical protein